MSKYLPICGRYNGNAKPIEADSSGNVKAKHMWESNRFQVCYNLEVRDTAGHAVPETAIDVSEYAIVSFRVINGLDQNVRVVIYDDVSTNGDYYAANADNVPLSFTSPTGGYVQVVTPDDIPQLNYLSKIKIRVSCATAPTSGKLTIWLYCKR